MSELQLFVAPVEPSLELEVVVGTIAARAYDYAHSTSEEFRCR